MNENRTPLLSINCLTYNHAPYIRACIEGFLMQQTSFPIEILIHDDASTDGTADIVREYVAKYPDLFFPVYQTENQYSKGVKLLHNHTRARGKYVAICEGDDYWTDPLKLQKQVDYMEANPGCALTCHRYRKLYQNSMQSEADTCAHLFDENGNRGLAFDQEFSTKYWITQPLTLVYRREARNITWELQFRYMRDIHLIYGILANGYGYCFDFTGGVYRIHEKGISHSTDPARKTEQSLRILKEFYKIEKNRVTKNSYMNGFIEYCELLFKQKRYAGLLAAIGNNNPSFLCSLLAKLFNAWRKRGFSIRYIKHYFQTHLYNH